MEPGEVLAQEQNDLRHAVHLNHEACHLQQQAAEPKAARWSSQERGSWHANAIGHLKADIIARANANERELGYVCNDTV